MNYLQHLTFEVRCSLRSPVQINHAFHPLPSKTVLISLMNATKSAKERSSKQASKSNDRRKNTRRRNVQKPQGPLHRSIEHP